MKQKQISNTKWAGERLGDVCDVRDGTHNSPKYVKEGYPLITSKNLTKGFIDFSDVNLISKSDFDEINKRSKVGPGDIIMPMIGTIGNPVIVPEKIREFAIKNVALIKTKDQNVFNRYIQFVLDSPYFAVTTARYNRGGTQKFIALGDIRNIKIPLPFLNEKPNLEEQERIVSILEESKDQVKKSEKATELLEEYLKSVFYEMFYGKGFEEKKLEEITNIVMGQSPPGDSYNMKRDGTPFFQGKAEFTEKYPVVKKWTTKPSKMAEPNSILMSVRAPVGDVNLCDVKCCIGRGLASIKPIEEVADLYYVYFLLHSIKDKIEYLGSGSTFKAITSKQLSSIKIPLPPILLQQKFAQIVEHVEKMKEYVRKTKLNAEELFNSLMSKAFRGKL